MIRISEDLVLEQVSLKYDLEFFELSQDVLEQGMEYCPEIVESCTDENSAKFLLDDYYNKFIATKAPDFFMIYKGGLVGIIGYSPFMKDSGVGELGFWISPAHQRKGVVSSCLKVVLEFGFKKMSLERVNLLIEPDNLKSIAFAKKNGFKSAEDVIEESKMGPKKYKCFYFEKTG